MRSLARPIVCIVTPYAREANNGNWRTSERWARMLRDRYRIIVQTRWDGSRADAMIALHARRSAASIVAFRALGRPLAVVLTGTDLYKDLPASAEAIASVGMADRLVVLQEDALNFLKPKWREKCEVIYQSAQAVRHRGHAGSFLECVAVGHLRAEKDPLTLLRAVAEIPRDVPIRIRHIGAPLDPALEAAARETARMDARYRYVGALPHGLARAAMARADLLVHPSIMEGGANVIVEAITSGTPVIASRISGNCGMLGPDYPGYFEVRHGEALAALLVRALEDPRYVVRLKAACDERKPLFHPRAEAQAVKKLVGRLLV
jgi:putative glycosyltransferase (TIGR04348 family)